MEKEVVSKNFIEQIIEKDLAEGKYETICTRFPPEPNGYLHIGHAKSILLNYGLSQEYHGKFNLRFDDTNPTKEKVEFVESIEADVKWLGADWEDRLFFASNYFEQMYEAAVKLIKKGKAFVCDLTAEEIREYRGTLTEPGKNSPYRDRSIEENLDLFERMKNGEFEDGTKVLRAKIDMASPNINMRDPVIYRVAHMTHHNTGDQWCIYPMYDFAHPIEDAIEGVTHSICTLEFEDHRPLYDWVVKELEYPFPPKQIEFAKLYLTNVVTGKRYIKRLVEEGIVDGWDDPRLVSIAALRRRGFTPESIKMFVDLCGVSKANSSVDYAMLEYCIREDLKLKRSRMMAVLDPLKLVIDNYPEDQVEELEVANNLENEALGSRTVPFGREIYIEREDFMVEPPKKYKRLYPDNEVRLMNAYFVKCTGFEKDENGNIIECKERTGMWAWKHPHSAEGSVSYTELTGDVRFEDVTFGYNEDKVILKDISLFAKPGQKLAFVGSTGAGKTTITNLINRFYDIQEGKIRYDGINITKIKKDDLRRSLGIVLQDTHLFTGTIMDNIRYGKLDATDEEVYEAAKLAHADQFIKMLPKGYDTMLSGDGEELSQGQRQLLSIARAAVANPPVLILDEATSSIDTRTESIVQKGMDNLMKGRTVFVIAHRLSTIRNSDAIIVLEHGKIIERGDHADLIKMKGTYYQLYTGKLELS